MGPIWPIKNEKFQEGVLNCKKPFLIVMVVMLAFQLAAVDAELLKVMKWRLIGPYRGGRVTAAAGHPVLKEVFYFGGAGSGVWKTVNGGEAWVNVSDGFFKTSSVGAIAVAPSQPSVIYVGMGEACLRGNISHGDGIYKSSDNGKTWQHMGLTESRNIARICIDPDNSDIVYVAALGHAFGPNDQRGVFRSLDGGKTWKRILFKSINAGVVDLVFEPGNSRVLYAAFWQVQRMPWGFESGGPDSAVYKSGDSGDSWAQIDKNPGFPQGPLGRIGLSVSPAQPERVWAIVEADKKGLYRSDNGGKTWQAVSSNADLLQRPWYYSHVVAHPKEADTVFVMNVGMWKSTDNGKSFSRIKTPHGDNHALWIDPLDPQRMIEGNDGGAVVTFNGGRSWSGVENQPTAQFYHVTTDNRFPYRVYGAQQDNSTLSIPSRSTYGEITKWDWYHVGGCESGYIAVHPTDPDIIYAGCYGGSLTRYDNRLKRLQSISVWPENPMGWAAKDLKYRFQWTFPIHISPHDHNVVYAGGNHVFRSVNQGRSWEEISPDLTRNDQSKMESSGGPLTKDNTSVEYYGTVFALVESPLQKGLIWAGSDDGLIRVSKDNGVSWQNVTPPNLPEWALISILEPGRFDAAVLYAAATRYKLDDQQPYLYVTRDYGKSWKKITNGIPDNAFTRVIREDPQRQGFLYAGTETGIYFSSNYGAQWHSLQLNLPVTPIHDLELRNNDLVAATHGRSFWILDDLTLLPQVTAADPKAKQPATPERFLFKPADTALFYGWPGSDGPDTGKSLPPGVALNYFFKTKPDDNIPVTLTILDGEGKTVRVFAAKPELKSEPKLPVQAGINQFVWNFSHAPSRGVEGAVFWGPGGVSPSAVPGDYRVRLTVGQHSSEHSFTLLKDPNLPMTQADYEEKFSFQVQIREKLSRIHDAVNEIRSIRKQVNWVTERTKDLPYHDKTAAPAELLLEKLKSIEDALIQHNAKAGQDLLNYPIKLNNKLAALGGWEVTHSWGAPTKQARLVFTYLSEKADKQLAVLEEILQKDVPDFNRLVNELAVPAVIPEHFNRDKKKKN